LWTDDGVGSEEKIGAEEGLTVSVTDGLLLEPALLLITTS
jgi:hypothetical protein